MIKFLKIERSDENFQQFLDFPKSIYPADSPRFAMPDRIPEDFLEGCYILHEKGKILVQGSLYNNPLLQFDGKRAFTIGNYESIDNEIFAADFLQQIMSRAKDLGAKYLIGPMNGSTWENYRFSTDHRHPPFFLEPYHHLYYNDQFVKSGFKTIAEYYTNIDTNFSFDKPGILNREADFAAKGVRIRPIDLSRFEEEIERIYEFNTVAFQTNFLYTPITKNAFVKKYLATKNIINPDFTLIAEDLQQNLIGYFFCIHDFLNSTEKSLIVKTLARHPDPEWSGLGHVIGNVVYRNAATEGYQMALHPFIYKQGTSRKLSQNFSGENYKNYVLYGKEIT